MNKTQITWTIVGLIALFLCSAQQKPPTSVPPQSPLPAPASKTSPESTNPTNLQRALDVFAREPTVRDTQDAALRYARIDPAQWESWQRRARWAHSAPGPLEARVTLDTQDDLREGGRQDFDALDEPEESQESHTLSQSRDARLTIVARWDVSRLIFHGAELDVAQEINRQTRQRQQLLDTIAHSYFARRRLQLQLYLSPPTNALAHAELQLQIQERTSELDAYTDGWFRRALHRASQSHSTAK